ncbi:vicilin-like seed storage protein [Tanacetum coccineum]|uniref:Vicilin-like seed storage protein n=1 Tax=Tanacetum coccineum TaxID=301880 RepID=A0ABQ4WUR1_9ASTR
MHQYVIRKFSAVSSSHSTLLATLFQMNVISQSSNIQQRDPREPSLHSIQSQHFPTRVSSNQVSFGQSEAKIEAIMNDFIQLKAQSNVYEAETMVEAPTNESELCPSRNNRPQLLAGKDSLLQTMLGPEFAAAFGMPEDRMKDILNAQTETTILPLAAVSPGGRDEEIPEGGGDGGDRQAGGDDQPHEFGFVVMGYEFDNYPKKMIHDIRSRDWFLKEHKEDSDEDDEDEVIGTERVFFVLEFQKFVTALSVLLGAVAPRISNDLKFYLANGRKASPLVSLVSVSAVPGLMAHFVTMVVGVGVTVVVIVAVVVVVVKSSSVVKLSFVITCRDPVDSSKEVSVSLGVRISSRGEKSRESNIGGSDNSGDGGTRVGGGINKLFKDSEEVLPVPLGNIGEAGYIVWKVRGKSILNIESRVVGRRHHSVNNPMSFVGNSIFDETKETSNETKGLTRKRRILQKMEDLKILEDLLKKIKMTRVTTAKVNGLSGYSVYVLFEVLNGKTHVSIVGNVYYSRGSFSASLDPPWVRMEWRPSFLRVVAKLCGVGTKGSGVMAKGVTKELGE